MKKNLPFVVLLIVLGLGAFFITRYFMDEDPQPLGVGEYVGSPFPGFDFERTNGTVFVNQDLQHGSYLVLYFNPECNQCHEEARSISKKKDDFAPVNILMVSPEPADSIESFAAKHGLNDWKNVTLLHDPDNTFPDLFHAASYPSVLAYGDDHRLLQQWVGYVSTEVLLEFLVPHHH